MEAYLSIVLENALGSFPHTYNNKNLYINNIKHAVVVVLVMCVAYLMYVVFQNNEMSATNGR